jgi:hypothetical protein
MPIAIPRAGRLVPASVLDFSRYSKNLAWLLECPLNVARELLADCYGFGTVHELQACIPAPGENSRPTGPFESPRARPPYYPVPGARYARFENRLAPLSAGERQLVMAAEGMYYRLPSPEGRRRRRYLAILDAAFFSAPAVHRKKFAEVKAGILAMEGGPDTREAHLETHWPPAFWSFLEWTQMLDVDAQDGLAELKDSSLYYSAAHVMSIGDMFHSTAAHRAPAAFLAMVGEGQSPAEFGLPEYADEWLDDQGLPAVHPEKPGLFSVDDQDVWYECLRAALGSAVPDELADKLYLMAPHELAAAPPAETPEKVLPLARKWRLNQLRQLSKLYTESEYQNRYSSGQTAVFWPDALDGLPTNGLDETAVDGLRHALRVTGQAPNLLLFVELEEHGRSDNDDSSRQLWKFKVLLTRLAHDEPEDVVGYMTGWLVGLASEDYVCDQNELLEDASYEEDGILQDGLGAFVNSYLPYAGIQDVLAFVNSRHHSSVAITEIVLRPKYRKRGLMAAAFSAFNQFHVEALFSSTTSHPAEANFDIDGYFDPMQMPPEVDVIAPGVFMVPVPPKAKRLEGHLLSTTPARDDEMDGTELEVFPFRARAARNALD